MSELEEIKQCYRCGSNMPVILVDSYSQIEGKEIWRYRVVKTFQCQVCKIKTFEFSKKREKLGVLPDVQK